MPDVNHVWVSFGIRRNTAARVEPGAVRVSARSEITFNVSKYSLCSGNACALIPRVRSLDFACSLRSSRLLDDLTRRISFQSVGLTLD